MHMKPVEKPKRNIFTMKCNLYYAQGRFKILVKKCENVREALDWCKEHCDECGMLNYHYHGHQILLEFY